MGENSPFYTAEERLENEIIKLKAKIKKLEKANKELRKDKVKPISATKITQVISKCPFCFHNIVTTSDKVMMFCPSCGKELPIK